ncbi:MAG: PEP-CTERM sorting domain-containing protein [Phycisphaerales bacterium]
MRTKLTILTLASLAGAATAQTTINFNDLAIDAAQPITFTVVQTDPGPLLGFTWDLSYDAIPISWGSELIIQLSHESGYSIEFDGSDANFADLGPSDVQFGWGNTDGHFTSTSLVSVQNGPSDTTGTWTVTVFDEFDDDGVDGVLNGSITINKVPAPGGLALIGLGSIACLHRRRRA